MGSQWSVDKVKGFSPFKHFSRVESIYFGRLRKFGQSQPVRSLRCRVRVVGSGWSGESVLVSSVGSRCFESGRSGQLLLKENLVKDLVSVTWGVFFGNGLIVQFVVSIL